MRKSFVVAFVLFGMVGFAMVAISAEDLAAAVRERRHLMKEVVAPAAKLGGQMVKEVNDLPVFSIKSKEHCHLTLINVDAKGEGTVIFPNKFQQDNFLPAGKEAQLPGASAPFQFRLKDPETETVVAICDATGKGATASSTTSRSRDSPSSAIIATS